MIDLDGREPNEFWQTRVHEFVDLYRQRTDLPTIRDFHVTTHDLTIAETTRAVLERAGWNNAGRAVAMGRRGADPTG